MGGWKIDVKMNGWIFGLIDGWMDGWMDGYSNVWMDDRW